MTGFSSTQMEQIRLALKDGLDVEEYGDPFVEALQIKDWREGKVPEAPRQPDENQSKEILAGLEKGLDVSLYADTDYSAEQMRQIRLGLEDNLDVSPILDKNLSAEQMCKIRRSLK